jgi:hypothetical protein
MNLFPIMAFFGLQLQAKGPLGDGLRHVIPPERIIRNARLENPRVPYYFTLPQFPVVLVEIDFDGDCWTISTVAETSQLIV